MTGELVLVAAIGIDGNGVKHPLGLIEAPASGTGQNSAWARAEKIETGPRSAL